MKKKTCEDCDGDGVVSCIQCDGLGEKECNSCGGTGKVDDEEEWESYPR